MSGVREESKTKTQQTLPPGWRWVRLGDVCEQDRQIIEPGTPLAASLPYLSLEHIESDTGRILRLPSEAVEDEGQSTTFAFDHRHVLYGKLRPYLNKVALPDFEGRCTTELIPLLRREIDRYFLAWLLRRRETVETVMRGTTGSRMPRANMDDLLALQVLLPPLSEQQRIAAILNERMAAIERARAAAEEQLELLANLVNSCLRQSLSVAPIRRMPLKQCLVEVASGVGPTWSQYQVIGATRAGLALAKEKVGKRPERYKLVDAGTIFYNPMRILLGSIATVDDGDEPGITSPDYVVFKTREGILHPRWFYYWFRSPYGEAFIKSLTRGAVRERLLFKRLSAAEIDVPPWDAQLHAAEKLKVVPRVKWAVSEQLDAINQMPAALLRQAFNGEL